MTNWDETYDVVVVGTGAAAFAAAITAADRGRRVLMLESTDRWGGSTAMSGGGLWLPNNPLMRRAGAADSREEALTYLQETVDDAGPGSSRERKEAFVDGVASFVTTAERLGMRFARAAEYPDCYPERPGGKIGRTIETKPFDRRRIGMWWYTSRGQGGVPAPVTTDDLRSLSRAWSSPGGMARGARLAGRVAVSAARRELKVGMGAALACAFLDIARWQGTPLWLSAPAEQLILEDGRVVGVRTTRDGVRLRVRALHGIILGGGGFDHHRAWREKHHGVDGTNSSGSTGNLGSAISLGEQVGAALDLMDDAWWSASIPASGPGKAAAFLVSERSMPHSLIIDAAGRRFANESESYVDLGRRVRDHARDVPGRFWLVADARHARKYLRGYALDPRENKARAAAGLVHHAATLAELAHRTGVDALTLGDTVRRFNGFARSGIDADFGRGNSAYDRYYGDPRCHPNPNLGALEKGPFTAVELVAGDLGTKGGLVTDAHARVLREDGSVIEGLYAAGNCSASVMGRTYPGPGATLGPAVVFGHLAALHAATHGAS